MKAFSAANQPEGEQAGPGVSTAGSDTAAEMIPRPGGRFMRNKDYFAATEPCMWRTLHPLTRKSGQGGHHPCLACHSSSLDANGKSA